MDVEVAAAADIQSAHWMTIPGSKYYTNPLTRPEGRIQQGEQAAVQLVSSHAAIILSLQPLHMLLPMEREVKHTR